MPTSDVIALCNIAVTAIAVLAAPIIALWIGGVIQRRASERTEKVRILSVLLSLRHQPLSADAVRTLNLIDVAFAKDRDVREAWSRFYATLNDGSMNAPPGGAIREEKRRDLILTICDAVGLARDITTADVLRAYGPTAFAKADELTLIELDIRLAEARKKAQELKLPNWNYPSAD